MTVDRIDKKLPVLWDSDSMLGREDPVVRSMGAWYPSKSIPSLALFTKTKTADKEQSRLGPSLASLSLIASIRKSFAKTDQTHVESWLQHRK